MSDNIFDVMSLPQSTRKALSDKGFSDPLPIQKEGIPLVREHEHSFLHSPTGSGKTLAFLLPAIEHLNKHKDQRMIVMAPTPELLMQTLNVFRELAPDMAAVALIGSGNIDRQKELLKKKGRCVFATPGRLFDFMEMKLIKPKHFHVLILDEVDAMVTEGHASILDRLVKPLTKDDSVGKIICASATVSSNAEVFFAEKLPRLQTGRVAFTTAKVKHYWLYTSSNRRDITLCRTIREARVKKGIIFIKDASKTAHVYHTLTEDGYKCDSMQAVATRQQRRGALDKFRAGEIDYLITTDLLARGMDVPGCDVIHYDMPRTIESFIHRAGRAGRGLSEDGRNFIITSSRDSYMLRKFRDACHIDIEELPLARGMRSKSQQGGFSRPKQQEGGKKIKDMKGYKGKKPSDEKEDKKSFRRPERGAARPARGEKKSEGGKPKENRRAPRGEGRAPRDTPKDSTAGGDGNRAPKKRN